MKKTLMLLALVLSAVLAAGQTNLALPEGTPLTATLDTTLSTFTNKMGDAFSARIAEPVMLNGQVMIPAGAMLQGRVGKVNEPRRISGRPTIGIHPEAVVMPTGERYPLTASLVDTNLRHGTDVDEEGRFKGAGHDGHDIAEFALGGGGGMLVGGLIGASRGTLIGGVVGTGLAVGHWLYRRNSAVLPRGTKLFFEINRPVNMPEARPGQ